MRKQTTHPSQQLGGHTPSHVDPQVLNPWHTFHFYVNSSEHLRQIIWAVICQEIGPRVHNIPIRHKVQHETLKRIGQTAQYVIRQGRIAYHQCRQETREERWLTGDNIRVLGHEDIPIRHDAYHSNLAAHFHRSQPWHPS